MSFWTDNEDAILRSQYPLYDAFCRAEEDVDEDEEEMDEDDEEDE